MKKVLAIVLAGIMALSLVACGGEEAPTTAAPTTAAPTTAAPAEELPEITLTIGSSAASSDITYQAQLEAAKYIEEKSGNKLHLNLVWDATLGGDSELIENCMAGSVDMVSLSSSPLLPYVPEIAVFDMPMVFETAEQAAKGLSAFTDSFQPIMNAKGVQVLNIGFQQFRGLSTNTNVQTPADFAGMSIRVMDNQNHILFWNTLGAKPTPLAFSELYLSLQQGLVDAQDNPVATIYANKFYEVQDYIMKITAFPFVGFVLINKDLYDGLPAEYQDLLVEFAALYNQKCYESSMESADGFVAEMEAEGVTVLPYTDEIIAALKEAAQPVYEQIRASIGSELPDALLAAAEAAK